MGTEVLKVKVGPALGSQPPVEIDLDPNMTVERATEEVGLVTMTSPQMFALEKDGKELRAGATLRSLGIRNGDFLATIPRIREGGSTLSVSNEDLHPDLPPRLVNRLRVENEGIRRARVDLKQMTPLWYRGSFPGRGLWKGRRFPIDIRIDHKFPIVKPDVRVREPIKPMHPNISDDGRVCLNILGKDWNHTLSLVHIIDGLAWLTENPRWDHRLNGEATQPRKPSLLARIFGAQG